MASYEAEVYRLKATGIIITGWCHRRYQPHAIGRATVLGSHSCVALSPVTVTTLYHDMPEAQSVKLKPVAVKTAKKLPTFSDESQKI